VAYFLGPPCTLQYRELSGLTIIVAVFFLAKVVMSNLAIERRSYAEQQNMWIGPRQVCLNQLKVKA